MDVVGDFGLYNLGIKHAPPMITRGVCIDAAGLNGGAYLEARRAVTRDDPEYATDAVDVGLETDDAV